MKSLMLKLSATLTLSSILATSLLAATDSEVINFLKKGLSKNPNIISLDISIANKKSVKEAQGWDAYILKLEGKVKNNGTTRDISQNSIYFVKGDLITPELINIKTGKRLNDSIGPDFKADYYSKSNLIYGNENAKHKVAIFSDPLCPFCRKFVPEAINYMKKYPNNFAIYYYHFPLPSLHPAAVTLTKAAAAAELQGAKDVTLKMYNVTIDAREKDDQKILNAFNKIVGTHITIQDIHSKAVMNHGKHDSMVASSMMVSGTPTLFFDGEKDSSKKQYLDVKVK
jgi:thiol:disulfide interchange protein DsbC